MRDRIHTKPPNCAQGDGGINLDLPDDSAGLGDSEPLDGYTDEAVNERSTTAAQHKRKRQAADGVTGFARIC